MKTYHCTLTDESAAVELGESTASELALTMSGDIKAVFGSLLVPTLLRASPVSVTMAHAHIRTESGPAKVKIVLYADEGGNPGALLGVSDEVTITSTTFGWVDFPFAAAGTVPANTRFFLGLHADAAIRLSNTADSGYLRVANSDTYSDGPSDPFGDPLSSAAFKNSIYIEGTGTKKIDLLVAEGDEGEPRVRLGSREKEAAKAGQRGTIVIQSLHHGSGQHVSRDPMMHEFADGMFADKPGLLQTRGAVTTNYTLATNKDSFLGSRGAIVGDISGFPVSVTPHAIYSSQTQKAVPPTDAFYTGSVVTLADRMYFGTATNAGVASSWATVAFPNGSWSNNAGFKASYLAAQADKMWRARVESITQGWKVHLSWTDDITNSNPTFASDFTITTLREPRDLAIIGPHAVVLMGDRNHGSSLAAVDAAGLFTPIVEGGLSLGFVTHLVPYLNGQLLILAGRPRALWMPSVGSLSALEFGGFDSSRMDMGFPPPSSSAVGSAVAAHDADIYFAPYGSFTKRDGNSINGTVIAVARAVGGELRTHILATPEATGLFGENAHISALVVRQPGGASFERYIQLHMLSATPNATNSSNEDWYFKTIDLWDGSVAPRAFDAGTKFLRTSRYSTPSRTTGQMEVMRGYITKIPDDNTVTVRVYLDGSATETYNFSLNSAGPFSQALPTNIIGRDIAIDFETNANGSVIIEFPWSIDYFAVPDQKDIVRLPILAGRDQLTRAGTLQKKTRAEILGSLADLVASPERWTLSWWDATPDWDVIPIDYQAAETEPDFVPGAGAAVAWLTLQRL